MANLLEAVEAYSATVLTNSKMAFFLKTVVICGDTSSLLNLYEFVDTVDANGGAVHLLI